MRASALGLWSVLLAVQQVLEVGGFLLKPKFIKPKLRRRSKCCRRKPKGMPKIPPPALLPLVPVAGFYGVMTAPIYGKGLFPGTGGFVDMEKLSNRFSTNEFLVAPADTCQSFESKATGGGGGGPTRTVAPVYDVDVETLEQKFMAMVESQYTLKQFSQPTLSKPEERQFVFVQRTPLLRFPDIINVKFLDVGSDANPASTLIAHSGSVYGFDDLGTNRKRLTDWIQRLDDQIAQQETALVASEAPAADFTPPTADEAAGDADSGEPAADAEVRAESSDAPKPPDGEPEAEDEVAAAVEEAADEVAAAVEEAADEVTAAVEETADEVAAAVEETADEVAAAVKDTADEVTAEDSTADPSDDPSRDGDAETMGER